MALGEFEIIRRFFSDIGPADAALRGVGDDCAGLSIPPGKTLQLSVDTLVADVHFPAAAPAALIARRALASCVSDLAAMGATPWCFTLALTLPDADEHWLTEFAAGLGDASEHFGLRLIGGDTTRGPLCITLQVMGLTGTGKVLQRNAAQPGDIIWLTGATGLARAALECACLATPDAAPAADAIFLDAYYRPQVPHRFAVQIAGFARAAIDISDGLIADLGHIAAASGCGAQLDCARLPLAAAMLARFGSESALAFALGGGDDYQLCFTAAAAASTRLQSMAAAAGIIVTAIGEMTDGGGVALSNLPAGFELPVSGYQHFSQQGDA